MPIVEVLAGYYLTSVLISIENEPTIIVFDKNTNVLIH